MHWFMLVGCLCLCLVSDAIRNNENIKDHNVDWHRKQTRIIKKSGDHVSNNLYQENNLQKFNKDDIETNKEEYLNEEYSYYTNKKNYRDFNLPKLRPYYTEEEKVKLDKLYGYTGPTANDEQENLVRPCALEDWQCIRKYFAANSDCTPAYGLIPDPFTLDLLTIYFTAVNMTVTFPGIVARGLSSAKVNTFYVNKKTGNLVFAMDVQNLNQTARRAYFRYRRTAKESIVLTDSATVNFRLATFTAVIPKVPHLRLELADIHVDVQNGNTDYAFGPEAANSTDPDVIAADAQTTVLLPSIVREGLFFNSQQLASVFIQKSICDFGLKIISV